MIVVTSLLLSVVALQAPPPRPRLFTASGRWWLTLEREDRASKVRFRLVWPQNGDPGYRVVVTWQDRQGKSRTRETPFPERVHFQRLEVTTGPGLVFQAIGRAHRQVLFKAWNVDLSGPEPVVQPLKNADPRRSSTAVTVSPNAQAVRV